MRIIENKDYKHGFYFKYMKNLEYKDKNIFDRSKKNHIPTHNVTYIGQGNYWFYNVISIL